VVDASIFESVLAITEALVPEWQVAGLGRERTGPTLNGIAPSNVYPTRDGQILLAANQDSVFRRLAGAMGRPDLADDPRFANHRARGANMAVLDEIIAAWTREHTSRELLDALHEGSVPGGLVYQPADMISDPHFRARRSLVEVEDPEHGSIVMPAVVPRLSETPGRVRWAGPDLGEHTDGVLRAAGLEDHEVQRLRAQGVI
jgi:crotonobetainyl-CoA:carnitine CoA-transferase CaiB-like acyl-CoA transferase